MHFSELTASRINVIFGRKKKSFLFSVTSLSLISSLPFLYLKLIFYQVAKLCQLYFSSLLINSFPSFHTRKGAHRGTIANNPREEANTYQRWPLMQLDFLWEAPVSQCILKSEITILRMLTLTVMYPMACRSAGFWFLIVH